MRGLLLSVLIALAAPSPAFAADGSPPSPPPDVCIPTCPEAKGGDGGFTVGDKRPATGTSERVPGRPAINGQVADEAEWDVVEEDMVPACTFNTRTGGDALCPAAVTSCPAQDQIRYWVWHRTTHYVDGVAGEPGPWVRLPGSYCLGPDDPGLDAGPTIADVIAQARAMFARVELPVFAVRADPAPTTLVNVPTAFSAGSAARVTLPPLDVLGRTVVITATPRQWRWFFGDGDSLTTTGPGRAGKPDVSHVYREAQRFTSRVQVVWTGTFTINGGDTVIDIPEPATTTSPPAVVDVRQARTELVRD